MEDELWKRVYKVVKQEGKKNSFKALRYSDSTIVLTYLWAVLHDRPVCWACRKEHWPKDQAWRERPQPATMSRRLRSNSVQQLLNRAERVLQEPFPARIGHWIDGKALVVSGISRDPDVGYGRGAGCKAKGYKLHLICTSAGAIKAWDVRAINVNEKRVAWDLVERVGAEGYLVGDKQYDSSKLYDRAAEYQLQLIAPRRRGKGLGGHYQSPHRLRSLALQAKPFGQGLLRSRSGIERFFAHLTNYGGGLGPLPNWVRRLPRVRLWVQAKLIINTARLLNKSKNLCA